jgi:CHAT domain-containing protein
VRAVVATRWAVGDAEAERMMAAFYRALGEGLAADDALRRARGELRRAGAPARTWGAFTLVGDGGVRVAPARRGSWLARLVGRR